MMPGSRVHLGPPVSKEPPRLPKPEDLTLPPPPQTAGTKPEAPPFPAHRAKPSLTPPAPAGSLRLPHPHPSPAGGQAGPAMTIMAATPVFLPPPADWSPAAVPAPASAGAPVPFLLATLTKPKLGLRGRLRYLLPVAGAALVCSAAVAAWRVWPAQLFFTDTSEPSEELLFHHQPGPASPLVPPPQPSDLFEEFESEGFHFQSPADYWERTPPAASPLALLKPSFTLRRSESSPPSSFGVGACDFALSTDLLPPGTDIDESWTLLPSVLAIQARFSCGLPERYEVHTAATSKGPALRCLRLVWEMLPPGGGEPARHLEMWIHQRDRVAWSMTGLMPGSTASYALTRTMERLCSSFSLLPLPTETLQLSLADRDLLGASPLFQTPAPQPLYRWTKLPDGTTTWPGGRQAAPGADGLWAAGPARIALVSLPPDGLQRVQPTPLLTALRQIWPLLRGVSIPAIDPNQSQAGETLKLVLPAVLDGAPAQAVLHYRPSERGITLALALIPEAAGTQAAPDPAQLLASLDLSPAKEVAEAGTLIPPSPLHLSLLQSLAAEAHADGRGEEAAAFHLALFHHSQRLEDLASACGSLASAGKVEQASRLFESVGERFSHTPGWELYRTLVLARLGAGTRAHQSAMNLLAARRFPGSLAAPYLDALINSRSWPQAKAFASMLVRNDPDSPVWRLHYAAILAETGERPKALAIIHATQQTWPGDAVLGIECVHRLIEWKNLQDASALAARVALAHPGHEQAQLVFGQCHTLLGRTEEARLAYQRALKAAPSSAAARSALASLATTNAQSDSAFVSPAIDPVPLPVSLSTGLPSAPAHVHSPAVYLSRITGYRFQRGRLPSTTVRARILIANAEGMSQWNTLTLSVNPHRERIALHYLKVLDPSGKPVARASLTDRYSLDTADGGKLIHFPIPGLFPGCLIEYALTTENLVPANGWPFTRHSFALTQPCLADICYLTGDTASLTWRHSRQQTPVQAGDSLIWREDQPALLATSAPSLAPALFFGTVSETWESVGHQYLEQIRHHLLPHPEVKAAATRALNGIKDPAAKVAALARRVRTDISYTAIEFGYRAIVPHPAATTLQNRFGDCKDQAVLLHSLLTAAGLPSHLALIHSSVPLHPDFPSLSQFDHMIVAVPTGNGHFDFIDPTDKFLEPVPGAAPHGLAGRQALVLDPAKPVLARTPGESAPTHATLHRLVTFPNPPDARISDQLVLDGPAAATLRSQFAPLAPAAQRTAMHRLLGLDRLREPLDELQFTALRDPSKPLEVRLTWQSRGALRPGPQEQQLFLPTPISDYLLASQGLGEPSDPPIVIVPSRLQLKTSLTLQPPQGVTLQAPTLTTPTGERRCGSWETTATSNSLEWTATLRAGQWTGEAAEAASRFPAEAVAPLRQPWRLVPASFVKSTGESGPTPAPAAPVP